MWNLIIPPMLLLFSCGAPQTTSTLLPTPAADPPLLPSEAETATLRSLEQVADYPLYTMHYFGSYPGQAHSGKLTNPSRLNLVPTQTSCRLAWGCSLFAALGDEENRLFGRYFDWCFSPALLLFTDPLDGYASVSMIDIEYLGFGDDRSRDLTDLPLEERRALLYAPSLSFDGMNERGLAVGMAAVNFLLSSTHRNTGGQCCRYDHINQPLQELDGRVSTDNALHLLVEISQDNTQRSILYQMTSGMVDVIMGREYS